MSIIKIIIIMIIITKIQCTSLSFCKLICNKMNKKSAWMLYFKFTVVTEVKTNSFEANYALNLAIIFRRTSFWLLISLLTGHWLRTNIRNKLWISVGYLKVEFELKFPSENSLLALLLDRLVYIVVELCLRIVWNINRHCSVYCYLYTLSTMSCTCKIRHWYILH